MTERIERHWREMRKQRAAARRERRRFRPAIREDVIAELRYIARGQLDNQEPNWLALPPMTLASLLNRIGLFTYSGQAFDGDSARSLRQALIDSDPAKLLEVRRAELRQRFVVLISKPRDGWSEADEREASGLCVALCEDGLADEGLSRAGDFLWRKLERKATGPVSDYAQNLGE